MEGVTWTVAFGKRPEKRKGASCGEAWEAPVLGRGGGRQVVLGKASVEGREHPAGRWQDKEVPGRALPRPQGPACEERWEAK